MFAVITLVLTLLAVRLYCQSCAWLSCRCCALV